MKPIYLELYQRDNYHCRSCNSTIGLHPHHIIFQSHQGPDDLRNLLTLCWKCHRALHDGDLEIEVLQVLDKDVIVAFTRLKNWKPI